MNKLIIPIIVVAIIAAGIVGYLVLESKEPVPQEIEVKEPISDSKEGFLAKEVKFRADDGKDVIGYLSKPEGRRKFPAIVLVHGGTSSKKATYNLGSQKHAQILKENGYVTLAVDYRESELGGKEIDDVVTGINYLKTLNFVDSNRIGIFGSSHGAYMSLMVSAKVGKELKAIVENFGFTDLAEQYNNVVSGKTSHSQQDVQKFIGMGDTYFGGSPEESPQEYEKRSPIYNVDKITAPVLIIHGKKDQSVPVDQAYKLRDALKGAGKIHEIKIYDNGPHGFIYKNTAEAKDAGKTTLQFFDRYLKY